MGQKGTKCLKDYSYKNKAINKVILHWTALWTLREK